MDAAATKAVLTTKEEDESETNNATTKKKAAPSGGRPSKKQKSEAKTAAEQSSMRRRPTKEGKAPSSTRRTTPTKRKNAAALEKGAPANAAIKEKKEREERYGGGSNDEREKAKAGKRKDGNGRTTRPARTRTTTSAFETKSESHLGDGIKERAHQTTRSARTQPRPEAPEEPAAHTVQSLFSDYEVDDQSLKARAARNKSKRAKEIVAGLKRYFDAALQKALLYEKEKKYYDLAVAKNDALKSKPASEICGAEHLLRLSFETPGFIRLKPSSAKKAKKRRNSSVTNSAKRCDGCKDPRSVRRRVRGNKTKRAGKSFERFEKAPRWTTATTALKKTTLKEKNNKKRLKLLLEF